jgi:LemA protein
MTPLYILTGGAAVVTLWIALLYNNLVRATNHCSESWADVDTELKRRYDLIPNLVATVKGYAAHESTVLEQVTRARATAVASTGSPSSQARDENELVAGLRQMMAIAEAYPNLKADTHFLELQRELVNTEDRIQRARRFYNANVRELANLIETFPSNMVAGVFRFAPREYFEIEEAARSLPAVS